MRKKIVNFSLILFLIFSYISTSFASTTESDNGIMKYYLNKYHVMDIKGYVNNKLHSTTFADGGYITYVKINDGNKKVLLDGRKIEDIEWNSSCNFVNDGNFVQLVYNVKNTSQKNMKLSVSGCVDVQISENDYATIERLPNDMGLKLCDDKNNIQFEFYGKNVMGTSDIDKLWIGEYYSNAGDDNDTDNSDDEDDEDDDTDISDDFDNTDNGEDSDDYQFDMEEEVNYYDNKDDPSSYLCHAFDSNYTDNLKTKDSAFSYSWTDKILKPNESMDFSILIGLGEINISPKITMDENQKTHFTSPKDISFSGNVKDEDSNEVTLFFKEDGKETTSVKKTGTNSVDASFKYDVKNTSYGKHTLRIWALDNMRYPIRS